MQLCEPLIGLSVIGINIVFRKPGNRSKEHGLESFVPALNPVETERGISLNIHIFCSEQP
jgi:hypothetical protein